LTIEVLPLGVRCSLACTYCYQQPLRDAGNALEPTYNMEAMKEALRKEGYKFTIFGGEPLLLPLKDLEELWRFGVEEFGSMVEERGEWPNSVQTHGADMTDDHIELFKKYKVGVGISIDGPDELNDARWSGSIERTRASTRRSMDNLEKLLNIGHPVSIITTLTRMNAAPERLPKLVEWLRHLANKGLRNVNLHLLEVETQEIRDQLSLKSKENVAAILAIGALQDSTPLGVEPLTDIMHLLLGEDQWNPRPDGSFYSGTSCTWNGCDPYTTAAVHGVDGQGNRGNCGRTCKEGPFWEKAATVGYERYISLGQTPMAYDGCQGCRFFYGCKGHCPGEGLSSEGLSNDWRAKTEHCETLMALFSIVEADLVRAGKKPLSLSPLREQLEQEMFRCWNLGERAPITQIVAALKSGVKHAVRTGGVNIPHSDVPHGDHNDVERLIKTHGDHTDVEVINIPHGDHMDVENPVHTHGDHMDTAGRVSWSTL
jgi:uncharacterized protein